MKRYIKFKKKGSLMVRWTPMILVYAGGILQGESNFDLKI